MNQEEPVDTDELLKNAYEEAYENPITLTASEGVHADSMPRVRAFAGNEDGGHGTYTTSREVDVIIFKGRENESVISIETDQLLDDVAHAMIMGTLDQFEDRDPDPDRAL